MNATVLLRAVRDPEAAPGAGARFLLDAPSLVALALALDWRRSLSARLSGIAAGTADWEPALREALALGLDEARRVDLPEDAGLDAVSTARLIAAELGEPAVIFAGSAASDHGSGLLPAALAGVLDWPLLSEVTGARQQGDAVFVDVRTAPGRVRTCAVSGPAVLAAAKLQPPPLYPPLARRLAAARTPVPVRQPELEALGSSASPMRFLGYAGARPRTKHLLKPEAGARAGDRLSQLMSGGARQRAGAQIGGDAASLARQLADILEKSGFLPAKG